MYLNRIDMKNKLIIDIDTDRHQSVIIAKPEGITPPETQEEAKDMVIEDMASMCEALCTLMHVAHSSGYKKDVDSLRDCISHLEKGFADSSYQTANNIRPEDGPKDDEKVDK